MPYRIHPIGRVKPDAFPAYFLDANVWIYILSPPRLLKRWEREYLDFFMEVIGLHSQNAPVQPKFIWTGQLLSEIINTWLRLDFANSGLQSFKRDYRPSQQCATTLKKLVSDLAGFEPYIQFLDDHFTSLDPFGKILPVMSGSQDFNDLFFYKLMKQQNVPIVTNDGDFAFEDVDIITNNRTLLSL